MKKLLTSAAAVLIAAVVAVPVFAARGSADFTRFVALGDSYGAGFESGSLNERHQSYSWPAIIAQQVGYRICTPSDTATSDCFAVPLVSFPGIASELLLQSLVPAPVITAPAGLGSPLMLNFARPYNNLSIPGATVGALLTLTGAEPPTANEPTAVTFARFILRGQGPAVNLATSAAYPPTFIALWIGGNDYLNVIFSGNPATLTPAADFKTRYEAVLDTLITRAPNAGMVVGNLPNGVPPYLRLVAPYLVDPSTGQPVLIGGNRVYYVVKNADGTETPVDPTTLIPFGTRTKLAQGYGIPAFLKNVPPFSLLPFTGTPLSPDDVITAAEFTTVITRIGEYNAIVNAAAAARNIPVADVAGLFNRVTSATGEKLGPITVTGAPVTGGFFSFDFFHLTDMGYLLMGNEFIKAINAGYDTEIPLASISQLYANNGAFFGEGGPNGTPDNLTFNGSNNGMTDEALAQIVSMWAQPTVKRISRGRAISH